MRLISLLFLLTATPVMATTAYPNHFQSPWHQSEWKTGSSATRCSLSQEIPNYGRAEFSQAAGGRLKFRLHALVVPSRRVHARMRSVAPAWKHNVATRDMGTLHILKSRQSVRMERSDALKVMVELEQGMFPTIEYQDWLNPGNRITVSLSAVNFVASLRKFQFCAARLMPVSLASLRSTRIYFASKKSTLSAKTRQRLDYIARYMHFNKGLTLRIDGHADSRGKRRYNFLLSRARAEAVQNYLKSRKVSTKRIKLRYFGENKPRASNKTKKGRAANRRVLVLVL